MADEALAKPAGVLFFCVRGKHRSAAAAACYLVRCQRLGASVAMEMVSRISAEQRGHRARARFHEMPLHSDGYPALAPLVWAAETFSLMSHC